MIYCTVLCWRRVNLSNDVFTTDNFCTLIHFIPVRYFLTTRYFYSIILTLSVHFIITKLVIIPFHSVRFIIFLWCCCPKRPWYPHSWGFYVKHDSLLSIGLLWRSDQLVAETSTWRHTTLTTNFNDPSAIQTHNLPGQQSQTDALVRAATGIGSSVYTPQFTSKHSLCYIF
jgi:hypothetical protein